MSLTFSIARVEYVTLWLVFELGLLGSSKGISFGNAETTSIAEPKSGPEGGWGVENLVDLLVKSDIAVIPLMATTGMSPGGPAVADVSGVTGGVVADKATGALSENAGLLVCSDRCIDPIRTASSKRISCVYVLKPWPI